MQAPAPPCGKDFTFSILNEKLMHFWNTTSLSYFWLDPLALRLAYHWRAKLLRYIKNGTIWKMLWHLHLQSQHWIIENNIQHFLMPITIIIGKKICSSFLNYYNLCALHHAHWVEHGVCVCLEALECPPLESSQVKLDEEDQVGGVGDLYLGSFEILFHFWTCHCLGIWLVITFVVHLWPSLSRSWSPMER